MSPIDADLLICVTMGKLLNLSDAQNPCWKERLRTPTCIAELLDTGRKNSLNIF